MTKDDEGGGGVSQKMAKDDGGGRGGQPKDRTLLFSLFCPVIFWPILSCAVIVWSGLVWFMCAWWIIDLLVFIVHFKTLAYDSIWCNILANLENEIHKIFPEENFLSDHLGKSFHIVDAVTWHAKLVGIVAQASEIQEHLWSTNGKMIFQINMWRLLGIATSCTLETG